MNRTILLVPILLAAVSVAASADPAAGTAPKASCIDPSRSYVARPLNDHEVFAQRSIGKPSPAVRVKTTCINLHPAIAIRFSSQFTCVGQGDGVNASINGGGTENCLVTGVVPYVPAEGDLHS